MHVHGDSSSSDESCSNCLAEYKVGEEVRAMPKCGHAFHKECVDRWLLTRSSFCPTCRDQVVERAVEQARTNCRNGNGKEAAAAGAVRFHFLQMSTQQFRGLLYIFCSFSFKSHYGETKPLVDSFYWFFLIIIITLENRFVLIS